MSTSRCGGTSVSRSTDINYSPAVVLVPAYRPCSARRQGDATVNAVYTEFGPPVGRLRHGIDAQSIGADDLGSDCIWVAGRFHICGLRGCAQAPFFERFWGGCEYGESPIQRRAAWSFGRYRNGKAGGANTRCPRFFVALADSPAVTERRRESSVRHGDRIRTAARQQRNSRS